MPLYGIKLTNLRTGKSVGSEFPDAFYEHPLELSDDDLNERLTRVQDRALKYALRHPGEIGLSQGEYDHDAWCSVLDRTLESEGFRRIPYKGCWVTGQDTDNPVYWADGYGGITGRGNGKRHPVTPFSSVIQGKLERRRELYERTVDENERRFVGSGGTE